MGGSTGGTPAETDPLAQATQAAATSANAVRQRIRLLTEADVYRDHPKDSHTAGICALARDIFGSHPQNEWDAAIDEWRRWLFREVHLKRHATGFWSECVRFLNDNDNSPARLELLLKAGEVGWASALNQGGRSPHLPGRAAGAHYRSRVLLPPAVGSG